MNNLLACVGSWYKDIQQNITFEVVAVDELEQTVETQLIDGEVGSYDTESWKELMLIEVETPEDWRNAYEIGNEDLMDANDTIHPEDWTGPLNIIESDIVNGIIDDL